MRKLWLLVLLVLLACLPAALAEDYSFTDSHFSVSVPGDQYDKVLTPYNLSTNQDWIVSQGDDYDVTVRKFANEGILLKAYDNKNDRILIITALKNWDAETYFDLNEQDEDMRKEFRQSHTNGNAYGLLGYTYTKAAWQKYSNDVQRFLHTAYSLKQNGEVYCTGFQRRTIRNGYTITLDMQVFGRKANTNDEKALEKVMKTLRFTKVLPMPQLPIKLNFTSAPPQETSEATFTVKGISEKNAAITGTVMSFGSSNALTYTDLASSGTFSFKVTLPSQGVYTMTVTAEKEGCITAQRTFSITYQKGLLGVELNVVPGEFLTDETVISGSTVKGATTQVSMTGPVDYTKSTTSQEFNFKLDTSAEGNYLIILKTTKKGMNERVFTFHATRSYSETERNDRLKEKARTYTHSELSKSANKGKLVKIEGYVTDITETNQEWLVKFAMTKSGENYKEMCYVIFSEQPVAEIGNQYTLYGMAAETYSIMTEGGTIKMYPRIEGYYLE